MDATAIITVDDVYEYLSVTGSDDDALIQKLIDRKTQEFVNYCQLDSFYVNDYIEYYDGNNSPYLFLKNHPINSIESIYDDGDWTWPTDTLIDSSDYRIVDKRYVTCKLIFPAGNQNIRITYNAGFSIIPADIQEVMVEEVTRSYNRRKDIDVFIKTLQDGSQHRVAETMMPRTKSVLAKYMLRRAI
jgi:hypothetical protein